jgi:plastocyanin
MKTKIGIELSIIACISLGCIFVTIYYLYLRGHGDSHYDAIDDVNQTMENGTHTQNDVEYDHILKPSSEAANKYLPAVTLDPNARVFEVTGINYGYDVSEIRVRQGETVTIQFESTDGFHDIVIDEFSVASKKVEPGVRTSVTFVADRVGTFEYYCSVGSHRAHGMVGSLIVEQ